MVKKFEAAMAKMTVLGHDPRSLIDCSEVIPVPSTAKSQSAIFPAGKSRHDVQPAVRMLSSVSSPNADIVPVFRYVFPSPLCGSGSGY